MGNVFICWLIQIIFLIGIIYVFGLIVWLLNRAFYSLVGRNAHKICVITGLIGTPIHEIGHAFFCVLFGHKIDEIRLFRPNAKDGVLGYVSHSYNKKNPYQQIGNFFIGIGPILFGSGVLLLLMFFLLPDAFAGVWSGLYTSSVSVPALLSGFWGYIKLLFAPANFGRATFWIFLVLACFITLHMSLSAADVKGSVAGLFVLLFLLIAADFAMYFVNVNALVAFTEFCISFGFTVAAFMLIAIVFTLLLIAVAAVVRLIAKVFKRA